MKNSNHKNKKTKYIKYFAYAALFIIAYISIATAQQQIPATFSCLSGSVGSGDYITQCINGAVYISIVALLFSFFVVALAYLVGEVVKIEQLKGWYKTESWELLKTIFLVVMLYITLIIINSIASGILLTNNSNTSSLSINTIYVLASQYLGDQVHYSNIALSSVTGMSIGIQDAKSLKAVSDFYLFGTVPGSDTKGTYVYGIEYVALKSDVLETSIYSGDSYVKNTFMLLISPMFILSNTLYDIFYVIVYLSLGILIPIGILFRAIPILRGVGGTIIAYGLVGAIFFPLILVALNAPINSFFSTNYYSTGPSIPSVYNGCLNEGYLGLICDADTLGPQGVFDAMASVVGGIFGSSASLSYQAATNGALFNGIIVAVNFLNYYTFPLMVNFILFIADLVIVYALAQGIAKMLGGTLKLSLGKKISIA
ncbi:MAG: hypothetical protein ACP5T6_01630 [Candidatus Micrarchaeia archaeon]